MNTNTEKKDILSGDPLAISKEYAAEGKNVPQLSVTSFLNSRVNLGGGDDHRETPDTRFNICCYGVDQDGNFCDFCLALTVPQMAGIVKQFFWGICGKKFFRQMVLRLLGKRWAVMTSDLAKRDHDDPIFGEWSRKMAYHKDTFDLPNV